MSKVRDRVEREATAHCACSLFECRSLLHPVVAEPAMDATTFAGNPCYRYRNSVRSNNRG